MKYIRFSILPLLVMVLLMACFNKLDEKLLQGEWKGAEWLVEGQTADYDASSALFTFDEKGMYSFNYAGSGETGKYHVSGNELFTTPEGGIQMMVKIEKLTTDSLVIQMNRGGTAEKLTLVRK